jgi:hypothetical protein
MSCFASGVESLSWNGQGEITNSDGKTIRLEAEYISKSISYKNSLFLIGYQISKLGIEEPRVFKVSSDLQSVEYWSFERTLKELFIFKTGLYLSDYAGLVFEFVDDNWKPAKFNFSSNAVVVYAENNNLIVCYPHSRKKVAPTNGACCSITQDWCTPLNWYEIKPLVCNDYLYVFENNNKGKEMLIRKIDLIKGGIKSSKSLSKLPEAFECHMAF